MGCAIGTIRYILFFFNFLLALLGLAICGTGVYVMYQKDSTFSVVSQGNVVNVSNLNTPTMVVAIVGACIFIFAFFGCCGALRESHCMIITYAVMLMTLFAIQVVLAAIIYYFRSKAQDFVNEKVSKAYLDYQTPNTKEWIDQLQTQLKCCGSTDNRTPWITLGIQPPSSCYPDNDTAKPIFTEGCDPALIDLAESTLSTTGAIVIIVAVVQVVGIIFSLCLASSLRRHSKHRGYA
ncbi:leukocyte surface antigen CD53-like isoform X3 [Homalodisca vitripennis]|uniref:leukocyte surface antigen CD53-like isoform X3 n=1 Tax=Homalodisca vitripennis TaxID=197043 RepID=UPI001EEC5482|nr:leukocyte surface antigen CD53-like isoform X3 [Homalodisca vitripennis]